MSGASPPVRVGACAPAAATRASSPGRTFSGRPSRKTCASQVRKKNLYDLYAVQARGPGSRKGACAAWNARYGAKDRQVLLPVGINASKTSLPPGVSLTAFDMALRYSEALARAADGRL